MEPVGAFMVFVQLRGCFGGERGSAQRSACGVSLWSCCVALAVSCRDMVAGSCCLRFFHSQRYSSSMNVPVLGGVQVEVHRVSVNSSILATGDVPVLPHEF